MNDSHLIVARTDFVKLMSLPPPPELREELERATVVPMESIGSEVVIMGARVSYRDLRTNGLREVEIVFPEEANPATGKVSVLAPVGAALIGLSVGQEIPWNFPDGTVHRLRVERVIRPAPPAESD